MSCETILPSQVTTFEWLGLDQLREAPLRAAVAYWSAIRGNRPFPSRNELKLRDMGGLLPYMSLVTVIDGGADFEHRIVGDAVVRAFNVPIQNRRFSEIALHAPKLIEVSFWLFRKVLETRAPLAYLQRTQSDTFKLVYSLAEMVLLPLGGSDETVDHVVAFIAHKKAVDG
jgi:hypothetical protein